MREGLDLDAILRAISPAERGAGGDGEKVGMYAIGGELGRQMPAAEMLKLWFTQAGKLGDACLEIKEGDIGKGAAELALALGSVTPGLSWFARKFGKPAKEHFFGK